MDKAQSEEQNDSEIFDKVVNENDEPTTDVEKAEPPKPTTPVVEASAPVSAEHEVTTQQQPTPPTQQAAAPVNTDHNKGGVIVLQWLTYAFWGWFASAVTILAGFVITSILDSNDELDVEAYVYPLSAVLVTYIFAMVADFFYRKHEPVHKTGASNVIMLIHAVIYILITAGAMIGFVFALLSFAIGTTTTGKLSAVLIATVALLVFGAVAVRVVMGAKNTVVRKAVWVGLSVLTAILVLASILGPVGKSIALKEDRLIEQNLPTVPSIINDYVEKNNKLPATLREAKTASSYTSDELQELINSDLVEYKPGAGGAGDAVTTDKYYKSTSVGSVKTSYGTQLKYQLCVNYKGEKNAERYTTVSGVSSDYYISTSSHPKGNVCYDLYATDYSYNR